MAARRPGPAGVDAGRAHGAVGPAGAPVEVARAHHGSVSRQERAEIEEALKAGRLPAVVATSSLELGIDMGAVDLVIQVEAPPSVASGLQRVGRAGHNVGDVSRGIIFPKYQGDLVQAAVVAERMRAGAIQELKIPHNPLDVLAQQVVAMTSVDDWEVDELEQTVRRAAPFGGLTRPLLEAVLDMLAGRYPSEDFAGLRPRIVWDRVAGTIRAGRARSGWPSPAAGRSLTGGCSACSWPRAVRDGSRAGSASLTRKWSTSRGSATCSCWAPARGGSRTSRADRVAGHPRAGAAGQAAVLARRHPRPARRAGPGHRRGLPRAVGGRGTEAAKSWRPPGWTNWPRAT